MKVRYDSFLTVQFNVNLLGTWQMGGKEGNRGYLIQAVIALLESLDDSNWYSVTIEPNDVSEKVDILWKSSTSSKAVQVKSSINQLNLPAVKKWAHALANESEADELKLLLVGPCSEGVLNLGTFKRVVIPPGQSSVETADFQQKTHEIR